MQTHRISSPLSRRVRAAAKILLMVILLGGTAWAAQRLSAHYAISIDTLGSGGGAAVSAAFRQPDSAIGQLSVCGPSRGASFVANAGVVQPWTAARNGTGEWATYR